MFRKSYAKIEEGLLIIIESYVSIANTLFKSLDLSEIEYYKVEVVVSK